jgi:hypothetical protein
MHNSLSSRLQTENPFDEFQKAVEDAIHAESKTNKQKNTFAGDTD